MKTAVILAIILGTIGLVVVLLVAAFAVGTLWNRARWDYGDMGPGMMGNGPRGYEPRGGMMEPWFGTDGDPGEGSINTLGDAEAAFLDYAGRQGYSSLAVREVMEFEYNYYGILAEEDTGVGAMELLIDKETGAVGPEPGPNMMWNAKYGHMGRGGMMGGYLSGDMVLTPEQAQDAAQRWLDANLPGRTPGEADAFYGYYTLHFRNGGEIEGMLSVNGSSGDVWYHSWHGDFIAMTEDHG